MNGLIKKDFYLIMKEIPVLFFVIVGAGGALANLTSPLIFIIAAAVIFSTATLATIQNDKATSWNKFSITLPVSKQQIVIEKYVVYALLVIFGILVGSVISIPIAIGTKTFQMDSYLSTVFIGLALALISGSFSIPCSFVFPVEKNVLIVSLSALGTRRKRLFHIFTLCHLFSGLILRTLTTALRALYGIVGRSLSKPAQIIDIFLSA